jgi:hypothetical protein
MRTVIYVRQPSTVTIQAKEDCLALCPFPSKGGSEIKPGPHHLDRGIYVVISKSDVEVSSPNVSVVAVPNIKDIPSDPELQRIAQAGGVNLVELTTFIAALVKDIEVSDGPAASATSKITDDPDGI